MNTVDVVVIGGGIVGLATARAVLQREPGRRVVVLEKEGSVAGHQTGRNSNVIHAGVYYRPGSKKALYCTDGRRRLLHYCAQRSIPFEVCGKLVVAKDESERDRLHELQRRCVANGVPVELMDPSGMREIEPHVAGVAALHVKVTGIVDYRLVAESMADEIRASGAEIRTGEGVTGGRATTSEIVLTTSEGEWRADRVVNCAGLHADRVATALGGPAATRGIVIVPFRGEYYELAASKRHLVRSLIYPVPDPQFPFLGVHLTRSTDGMVHAGPNAVFALAREGYSWRAFDARDVVETLGSPGFRRLAASHWRYGATEMIRSLSRRRFAAELARLVPAVTAADLSPAPAGVRAQAVLPDGRLADDFEITLSTDGRVVNVLNAPSPAATASLAIGEHIAAQLV